MRIAVFLLALAASAATMAETISDEFTVGFGGVPWGIEFSALVREFPGGYTAFSTSPGRVSYTLNIDDPVLGISRRGQYVEFGIGTDGKVDAIQIQIPYAQTSTLISILTSKFGIEKGIEVNGVVTKYQWPTNKGLGLAVRTTNNRAYGLTTLLIGKIGHLPDAGPSGLSGRGDR
jgi:hypothetical protein